MWPIVVLVMLMAYCNGTYVEYQDTEDDDNDDADFDDHYDTEDIITTTTFLTPLEETSGVRYRIRRFGDQSSGARTLSLDEIRDVKGAIKELLAGHQLDHLTTSGTNTIANEVTNAIEHVTRDLFTGLTKTMDSVDSTKFYEDIIEEIIDSAKKQGYLVTANLKKTETTTKFETLTDAAYGEKTTEINSEVNSEANSEVNSEVNSDINSEVTSETTSTIIITTDGDLEESLEILLTSKNTFPVKTVGFSQRNTILPFVNRNLPDRVEKIKDFTESVYDLSKSPKYSSYRTRFVENIFNIDETPEWVQHFSNINPGLTEVNRIPKRTKPRVRMGKKKIKTPSRTTGKEVSKSYDVQNQVSSDRDKKNKDVFIIRNRYSDTTYKEDNDKTDWIAATAQENEGDYREHWKGMLRTKPEPNNETMDPLREIAFTPRSTTTSTTTRRPTLKLADPHHYPYPYSTQLYPITTTPNFTTTWWRTRRRKTTTKPPTTTPGPQFDIPALVAIVANLTRDYEANITGMFNETLQKYNIPTCPSIEVTEEPIYYDLVNATVVAKCFVCGLHDEEIPRQSYCADAFAPEFLPLVPIDPQSRQHLVSFRKYCRYLDVNNYYENETEPRSVYGRFTGGCSVRWIDLSTVYTQRACRNKRRAMTGKHFASKRMAKLEMALNELDNGCIISPMASLVPLSRGVSLFARFHACVCTGSWCNITAGNEPWMAFIAIMALLMMTSMLKGYLRDSSWI